MVEEYFVIVLALVLAAQEQGSWTPIPVGKLSTYIKTKDPLDFSKGIRDAVSAGFVRINRDHFPYCIVATPRLRIFVG
jgi:hypothetical protein